MRTIASLQTRLQASTGWRGSRRTLATLAVSCESSRVICDFALLMCWSIAISDWTLDCVAGAVLASTLPVSVPCGLTAVGRMQLPGSRTYSGGECAAGRISSWTSLARRRRRQSWKPSGASALCSPCPGGRDWQRPAVQRTSLTRCCPTLASMYCSKAGADRLPHLVSFILVSFILTPMYLHQAPQILQTAEEV